MPKISYPLKDAIVMIQSILFTSPVSGFIVNPYVKPMLATHLEKLMKYINL